MIRTGGVFFLLTSTYLPLALSLIILGTILDNTDGQYARCTDQTCALGGLYDLWVDFLFVPLFYGTLGYLLWQEDQLSLSVIAGIALASCLCVYLCSSIWAYIIWRENNRNKQSSNELQCGFLSVPALDQQDLPYYQRKLTAMMWLFQKTWRACGVLLFWLLPWRRKLRFKASLHLFAFGAYGQIITVNCIMLAFSSPILWALTYPLALFLVLALIVAFNESD